MQALMVHETFNLAQMLLVLQCPFGELTFSDGVVLLPHALLAPRLQGENVPGNVAQLQELVLSYGTEGEEVPARVSPFSVLFWNDLRK